MVDDEVGIEDDYDQGFLCGIGVVKQLERFIRRKGFTRGKSFAEHSSLTLRRARFVDVAAKLPEKVIQEDEKLLMYYNVATMRLGGDL